MAGARFGGGMGAPVTTDPRRGCDYSQARPTRAQLDAADLAFCVRYIESAAMDAGKRFTLAEAQQLTSWGRKIVCNFEYATGGMAGGAPAGIRDAKIALTEMKLLGVPKGRPCYFSNDTNTVPLASVVAYLDGASTVLTPAGYGTGLYGGLAPITAAYNAGYRWLWQTYAWSPSWHPAATLRQTWNAGDTRGRPFPWDGDLDQAMTDDFGQWDTTGWTPGGDFMALTDSEMGEILLAARRLGDMYTMKAGTFTARFTGLEKALSTVLAGVQSIDSLDDKTRADLAAVKAELDATAAEVEATRAGVEAGTTVVLSEEQLARLAAQVGVDQQHLVAAAKQAMREGTGG